MATATSTPAKPAAPARAPQSKRVGLGGHLLGHGLGVGAVLAAYIATVGTGVAGGIAALVALIAGGLVLAAVSLVNVKKRKHSGSRDSSRSRHNRHGSSHPGSGPGRGHSSKRGIPGFLDRVKNRRNGSSGPGRNARVPGGNKSGRAGAAARLPGLGRLLGDKSRRPGKPGERPSSRRDSRVPGGSRRRHNQDGSHPRNRRSRIPGLGRLLGGKSNSRSGPSGGGPGGRTRRPGGKPHGSTGGRPGSKWNRFKKLFGGSGRNSSNGGGSLTQNGPCGARPNKPGQSTPETPRSRHTAKPTNRGQEDPDMSKPSVPPRNSNGGGKAAVPPKNRPSGSGGSSASGTGHRGIVSGAAEGYIDALKKVDATTVTGRKRALEDIANAKEAIADAEQRILSQKLGEDWGDDGASETFGKQSTIARQAANALRNINTAFARRNREKSEHLDSPGSNNNRYGWDVNANED